MKPHFDDYCTQAKMHFRNLESQPLHSMGNRPKGLNVRAIYILYEDGKPVYVGRSNKLSNRLRQHITPNHNQASFALKRTREQHSLSATYKPEGSRQSIVEHDIYGSTFRQHIEKIKRMEFRFLKIEDHIEQYLTELLVTMELGLSTSGFDNS